MCKKTLQLKTCRLLTEVLREVNDGLIVMSQSPKLFIVKAKYLGNRGQVSQGIGRVRTPRRFLVWISAAAFIASCLDP